MWSDFENRPAVAPTPARWREPLLFVATLVVAMGLYLATRSPGLAAILPCLYGGYETLRTGLWVLRSDPCPARARTCFTFYLAAACWKAAAAACLSVGVFVYAAIKFGFQPDMDQFAATMLVLAGGVVLNTCIGLIAIRAALRHNIRVWVHPRLRTMTGGDLGRVAELGPIRGGMNHAVFVAVTALMFPAVAVGALVLAVFTVGQARKQCETLPAGIFTFVAIFGGPFAMIPVYAWLSSRIVARSPQECWPEVPS